MGDAGGAGDFFVGIKGCDLAQLGDALLGDALDARVHVREACATMQARAGHARVCERCCGNEARLCAAPRELRKGREAGRVMRRRAPCRQPAKSSRNSSCASQKVVATIEAVRRTPGTSSAISPKQSPAPAWEARAHMRRRHTQSLCCPTSLWPSCCRGCCWSMVGWSREAAWHTAGERRHLPLARDDGDGAAREEVDLLADLALLHRKVALELSRPGSRHGTHA